MKKIIYFSSLILLISCNKNDDNNIKSELINLDFNTRILDNYFITSIAFDNLGNAWIGTFKQGLLKYNSGELIIYDSNNSIIPDSSVINDIAIDSKNNVWIGCDGLIKFDGTKFTFFNTTNTPIPEDYVRSIAIDSKDNIWFSSSRFKSGGLVKYNGNTWTAYNTANSQLPVNSVISITVDNKDNVWVALSEMVDDSYLVKISEDKWTVYSKTELGFSPYYIGNIQINSQGKIYGAIDYSLSSMINAKRPNFFIFDGNSSEPKIINNFPANRFITIDNYDNLWCVGVGGYAVYNGAKWIKDELTFKDIGIFALEQSKDNKIWIGTGKGIYINK